MSHRWPQPPPDPTRLFGQQAAGAPDLLGTTVGGYRIDREIGRGGMGIVYSALHPILGRRVAVKVLHRELSSREDLRERFIAEARAAAALHHPHIVRIFDLVPVSDGRLCLVMEYLEGQTLEERAGRTPMPAARVRSLLLQLCGALATAHQHGIIHRDLKPHNVLLVAGGIRDCVKLLDFGVATLELARDHLGQAGTPPGIWIGTPHYSAPEQIMGEPVDRRADIYALGVLGYRLLCGAVPFDGPLAQVMYHHMHTPPPEPDHVPPELRRILRRALAKRREERFADIDELARALQGCRLEAAPAKTLVPVPPPFTVRVDGSNLTLRFVSEAAFQRVERHELRSGRLFVPGKPPTATRLTLIFEIPGRPLQLQSAELLASFGAQAAEKHGIPEGFVLTLRGSLQPQGAELLQPVPAFRERAERFRWRLAVAFSLPGSELYSGHLVDYSATGLGLSCPFVLPRGLELFVAITLPSGERAHGRSSVVWSREGPEGEEPGRAGLRLLECDERYLELVETGRARQAAAAASITEKVARSG